MRASQLGSPVRGVPSTERDRSARGIVAALLESSERTAFPCSDFF
jgi:hypothetical protein